MTSNVEHGPEKSTDKVTKGHKAGLEGTVAKAALAANGNGAESEEYGNGASPPLAGGNVAQFPASPPPDTLTDLMREAEAEAEATADPYANLMSEAVESPDDFGAGQPILGAIPVRSPVNGEFLRCHPTFQPRFHLYLSPYTKRSFLVYARFVPLLGKGATRLHTLRLFITPTFAAFIWPVKVGIATSDLSMTYARSRDTVVAETIKRWMSCSQTGGLWTAAPPSHPEIYPADDKLVYPPGDDNSWLALAWRGNIIDYKDHDEILFRQGAKLPA